MFSDASEFTTLHLHVMPEADLVAADRRNVLPHLAAFRRSIMDNQAIEGRNARKYTTGLYLRGYFEIVSPITGNPIRSGSSLILRDRTVVFSFPEEPDIFVAAGDLGSGFPICAAVLSSRKLVLYFGDFKWGFSARHFPMIAEAARATGWAPGPVTRNRRIVIGDANFAHHAWNELSCLEELLSHGTPNELELVAIHESLGAINELFEEVAHLKISHTTDAVLERLNRPGALLFPVGGQVLTRSIVRRIFRFSEARKGMRCETLEHQLRAWAGPVLWMSVRTRNRTATNQRQMLAALGRDFLDKYPKGCIVVDGYSFPLDYEREPTYVKENSESVCAEDMAEAAILLNLLQVTGSQTRVFVAVGLKINDSILLARLASIYICHHGTVQHKVGWFHSIPGLVHCNRKVLADMPSAWVASKSEVAIRPLYIPIELVEDVPLEGEKRLKATLNNQDNYTIVDISKLASVFHSFMDTHLR
jgi:hypothetical protein